VAYDTSLAHILLDCLGRLNKVKDLPPYRIPTKCSHSDILKNVMANCSNLSFLQIFSHVKAHQDDGRKYGDLSCEAQLNCPMDYLAKKAIHEAPPTQDAATQSFPLEPLCVFLDKNKLTSDKRERLKFWVRKQLARTRFHKGNVLHSHKFDKVDWDMVHTALRVPSLDVPNLGMQANYGYRPG
jgi:hypothetical protein